MHHHDHNHAHSMNERIEKIITHWIKHNDDHIKNYKDWSDKASQENLSEVADLLNEVADMSLIINEKLNKALTFF
jgi:rubrerythrin